MKIYHLLLAFIPLAACQSQSNTSPKSAATLQLAIPGDTIRPRKEAAGDDLQEASGSSGASPHQGVPKAELDYLTGKFNPASRTDFVKIGPPYTDKTGMMLRRETFEAFKKMWAAAKKDGVTLRIISSTRTFAQQKAIWDGKWSRFAQEAPGAEDRARKILEYSAMPGASRHHWGTDVDLNDLNNETFQPGSKQGKVYEWLTVHAHEYGFCQPYTAGRPFGYNEERWHWSYLPLAKPLLENYARLVRDTDFGGFQGAETANRIGMVEHYALGINADCR